MTSSVPEKLGKYEIKRQIGRGSMGIVYEGYDPFSDNVVAVKVARSDALKNPDAGARFRKMFFNEAHTAGKLKHPNIVEILDAGADGEACYIVMEMVRGGRTLKQYTTPNNLLPYEQVIEIMFKCAKALDYAHREGVIHRDIKPTNILVTDDMDVKIGDFSIAHLMTADTAATMPLGFVGSPRYMSPEQVQEDNITNQTDLFSLGIVMYELFTGKHPFAADGFSRLIHKITNERQPPLKTYRTDIPEILEKIVYHALEKDTRKRYKMGLNLAGDLSLAFDYLEQPVEDVSEKERFRLVEQLDFFKGFPEAEIWEVIRACQWQEYEKGSEIQFQDDIDDAFYVVASGTVDVELDGKKVGSMFKDDCFGEMGGQAGKSGKSVRITAREYTRIMKINATLIDQFSVGCQLHFNKVFLRTLVKRLSFTNIRRGD
ncbi:MAG: serine/threonine-protein kinase [Gammaproteobacteria bacterium]